MKSKKKPLFLLFLLLVSLLQPLTAQASEIKRLPQGTNFIEGWPKGPAATSMSAVLLEADTGVVVYNKRMTEKRYPASVTKILTALVVLENASLDEQVTFDETGLQEISAQNSNIGMLPGEVITVEQCLYALLLESANEVATQLAQHVGGTVENFVQMMNDRAEEIGCTGTHFANASGLPDENHYTTAYDLAIIMQECLKNETFRTICGTYQYELPATNMDPNPLMLTNHQPLIQPGQYHYDGVIAGKTGYTDMSKNTLATAAEKDGYTYIAVTLGADIGGVISDTTNLLNYGFDSFEKITIEDENLLEDGVLLVPKGTKEEDLTFKETDEDGSIRRTYCFSKDTYVGTALCRPIETPEPTPLPTEEPTPTPAVEPATASAVPYIIIGVLSGLILLGIFLIILQLIKRKK